MQFTFDPLKDAANILKHGLSLSDEPLVFKAVNKLTIESNKQDEARLMDVAMVEVAGVVLVLIYVFVSLNRCGSYRCAVHPNRKGGCMPKTQTKHTTTDWERVKHEAVQDAPIAHAEDDGPYDPNDAAVAAAYWQQASIVRGRGRPAVAVKRPTLNMRVDADVLEAFKATGQGWQTRINAALREAVAHGLTKA